MTFKKISDNTVEITTEMKDVRRKEDLERERDYYEALLVEINSMLLLLK